MNKIEQLIKKIIDYYCDEVVIDIDENGIFSVSTIDGEVDGSYEDGQTLEEALENFVKRYCK